MIKEKKKKKQDFNLTVWMKQKLTERQQLINTVITYDAQHHENIPI